MMTGGHDATQLPVVMLGGGGGKIETRPRARLPRPTEPPDVPAVSVDDGQDERADRQFGDATEPLAGGVAVQRAARFCSTNSR